MADWAPDYTYRYKARYLAGGITHDFTVRGGIIYTGGEALAVTMAAAVSAFFGFLEAQLIDDFEFLNASWAYADSNSFTPTVAIPTSPTGAIALAGQGGRRRATACTMSGRADTESKGKLYFFGLVGNDVAPGDAGSDGKISASELPAIEDAKAVADSNFRSAHGDACIFYPQFTIKVNDHTLRLIRRVGT